MSNPGVDCYPFVRLHQPSSTYGVESTPLGQDRVRRTSASRSEVSAARLCRFLRLRSGVANLRTTTLRECGLGSRRWESCGRSSVSRCLPLRTS